MERPRLVCDDALHLVMPAGLAPCAGCGQVVLPRVPSGGVPEVRRKVCSGNIRLGRWYGSAAAGRRLDPVRLMLGKPLSSDFMTSTSRDAAVAFSQNHRQGSSRVRQNARHEARAE